MPAGSERRETIGADELRTLETSVLKTLCLTINTAGSELKYKILDSLSDDDFYFPILRAVFRTLSEMHMRGDYVISSNLEEELSKGGPEPPAGFSIEQLFDGTLPSLTDLNGWVVRLKERSRSGLVPTVQTPLRDLTKTPPPRADATVVRAVAEVKKRIAEEARRSNPPTSVDRPPPAPVPAAPSSVSSPSASSPDVKSAPGAPLERSSPAVKLKPPPTPAPREKSAPVVSPVPAPKGKPKAVLSSEGEDWTSYLEDLASKQGKRFDTGFVRLDGDLGGLAPGLMLLVDEDRARVVDFLKQVTDQVARARGARCLFVATELPKPALRLRTLSRLSMVPLRDIERGRLKKDSPEWQRVDRAGRGAADWLRSVFVYEAHQDLDPALLAELTRKLQESAENEPCLVVVDSLERVERSGGTIQGAASELKNLADSLDVLLLAATTDPTLLASKDADYAAVFRQAPQGQVELEILRSGRDRSTVGRFQYEPATCRFSESE